MILIKSTNFLSLQNGLLNHWKTYSFRPSFFIWNLTIFIGLSNASRILNIAVKRRRVNQSLTLPNIWKKLFSILGICTKSVAACFGIVDYLNINQEIFIPISDHLFYRIDISVLNVHTSLYNLLDCQSCRSKYSNKVHRLGKKTCIIVLDTKTTSHCWKILIIYNFEWH